jgi:hypothetical protein
MLPGVSEGCKSYLLGACLIFSMCPVFASGFNCEFLRNDAGSRRRGGTNHIVDLPIVDHF